MTLVERAGTLTSMSTSDILSTIDQEIARLEQVRSLLQGVSATPLTAVVEGKRRGRPPGKVALPAAPLKKARTMSAEGRERIAAAQKARWSAKKKADQQALKAAPSVAAKKLPIPAKKALPKKTTAVAAKPAVSPSKTAIVKRVPAKKKPSNKTAVPAGKTLHPVENQTVLDAEPSTSVEEVVAEA